MLFMVEKGEIGRFIGMLAGDAGIGRTNEAAFSVTGIIIGEPLFYAVSNHLTRINRTASL